MLRRPHSLLSAAAFLSAALWLTATAQPPADGPKSVNDLRRPQEQNAKVFRELRIKLLELAQRLERGDKPEDKERAKTIRAALEQSEKAGIDNQFAALLAGISKGTNNPTDVQKLIGQNSELEKSLVEMLAILMTDDESARLKAEIEKLERFLKEAEEIKRRQEVIRAMTESAKGDKDKLAKNQADLAEQTKELGKRMAGKTGDPKDAKKGQPKAGEPKDGKDSKDGKESKDAKGKDGKEAKDGKDSKEGKDSKDGKESKDGKQNKDGKDSKDAKEGKQGKDTKDAKDAKESKDSKKGQPSPSQPKDGPPQDSPPMDGQQPPPDQQPQQPQLPGRKKIQEAYPHQKNAEDELKKDQRPPSAKQQDEALKKLQEAIEELKKRLKQLREEETLKTLAALEARCQRMLALQIEVYEQTKQIDAAVKKNGNRASNAERQRAQQQSDKEKEIVAEADKALQLLASEGSAVAFARVLEEVRGDMQAVQRRLEDARVDADTQTIEENVIAMLKDMVAALKKAQQDIQNQQNQPSQSQNRPPPNQRLIDMLAELRLIRAMQMQVNQRTKMHGSKSPSEQAADPLVQAELKQLAARQAKLQEMIQKIVTGANQ